jgi:tRNA G10  N-methylase Trm11
VLAVLSAGRCDGNKFFLPATQLDRKLYESTNKVLDALGGKWNRSAKAHLFADDCTDRIEGAIETGEYTRPADMGWFPTPPDLARRVVDMAGIEAGMSVLEPSAGTGAIAAFALARGADVVAVEIDAERVRVLAGFPGLRVMHGDFMNLPVVQAFDRVVMNPPFAKRADIHHVMHAYAMLNPGGKLVAIMSAGVEFREDRLAQDFRARCTTIERLPDESFKASGTSVCTVVVTMEEPV